MACSKYDYEVGYEDNRFEFVVSQRFHCPICFLVLKDPVMCKNEHYYCSSCMKKHLENSSFCPTCLEHLSVDTLRPASRIVNDYISELNIHCDFYPRGCPEMVQVENLKRHVASCGFSPVQCSNDGCNVLVNASDKLHHETEVCDFRKMICHDCGQVKNEVKEMKDEMKDEMKGMKGEIKNEMQGMKGEIKNEMQGMKGEIKNEMEIMNEGMKNEIKDEMKGMKEEMKEIIDQVLVHQDQMQDKISKEVKEEVKDQMKNEMKGLIENEMKGMKEELKNEIIGMKEETKKEMKNGMKGMKEGIKNEMKEIVMNAVRDAVAGIKDLEVEKKNSTQSSQATCSSDASENIFVVGGHKHGWRYVENKSTECFNWADQTWTLLDSAVIEGRFYSCSFLHQGQMVVAGGYDDDNNMTNTMKCLNIADPAATWKDFAVNLPVKCYGHKVVSHNDQLFMSGGYVQPSAGGPSKLSDAVYEVQLVPPYSSKMLTRLPQSRSQHGMEMFDQKLFILGGYDGKNITASVVQYDLIKNECKEMPPLPYAVQEMATVLWRNNVLVIGGLDHDYERLNNVAMYDVITGRSQMLLCMKRRRYGCTAVLTGNVVVVMGGRNGVNADLKSVECFDLERQVWQDLPDMLEPRVHSTAVVKSNH
ncbi:RING finger 151-like isoform X2 [Paramuricea clavata]|uniref:RING finger 151-like isoform X2 n=1 Tax=Paramuricea clavata TaxID=317549 RepID=A0A7D9HU64_PARCT|nr:RING finger 151-like isoform X2 [Paramuricea clavata]